jgi:hypothetical protein
LASSTPIYVAYSHVRSLLPCTQLTPVYFCLDEIVLDNERRELLDWRA